MCDAINRWGSEMKKKKKVKLHSLLIFASDGTPFS
jgi:hypothetical protein